MTTNVAKHNDIYRITCILVLLVKVTLINNLILNTTSIIWLLDFNTNLQ